MKQLKPLFCVFILSVCLFFQIAFKRTLVKTTAFLTISIALILLSYTVSLLTTDHVVFSPSKLFDAKEIISRNSRCQVPPLDKLLTTPATCKKAERLPAAPSRILSGLIGESIDLSYLEVVGSWTASLTVAGLALQLVAAWHSGRRLAPTAWAVLFGIEVFQQSLIVGKNYNELFQIVKVCFCLHFS